MGSLGGWQRPHKAARLSRCRVGVGEHSGVLHGPTSPLRVSGDMLCMKLSPGSPRTRAPRTEPRPAIPGPKEGGCSEACRARKFRAGQIPQWAWSCYWVRERESCPILDPCQGGSWHPLGTLSDQAGQGQCGWLQPLEGLKPVPDRRLQHRGETREGLVLRPSSVPHPVDRAVLPGAWKWVLLSRRGG